MWEHLLATPGKRLSTAEEALRKGESDFVRVGTPAHRCRLSIGATLAAGEFSERSQVELRATRRTLCLSKFAPSGSLAVAVWHGQRYAISTSEKRWRDQPLPEYMMSGPSSLF